MKNIVIMDLGSRLNSIGGQARMASVLFRGLKKNFNTFYLGYETDYIKKEKNAIILERGKKLNANLRKNPLSETWIMRIAYNFVIVRHMLGINPQDIYKKLLKIHPSAIIANSINDITLLKYLRKKGMDFKCVYIDHGSISTTLKGYFSKESIPLTIGSGVNACCLNSTLKKFFGFFDVNIALNSVEEKSISKHKGKVEKIYNGLDIKVKSNKLEEEKLRKKFEIKKGDFVILYLGRMFERQKNISLLINAFKSINNDNMHLILAGDGPSMQDYKMLANGDSRISFTGHVYDETINLLYNISNLFVLPSNWEAFSLVVLEAAAHSLPILLSENIALPEFGKEARFNPRDANDLRKKIMEIYKNKKARERLIKISKIISKKYTEKNMLAQYSKLIKRLTK
ncbi:MAG: glycosyltransferase family 4 protein [Candidatus Micrarchaeaceae archaeon]